MRGTLISRLKVFASACRLSKSDEEEKKKRTVSFVDSQKTTARAEVDVIGLVTGLEGFGYTCSNGSTFAQKLSLLASTFSLNEEDLGNAIIAFASNQKKKNIDMMLLELLEPELAKQAKVAESKDSASRARQSMATTPSRRAALDISMADSVMSFCESSSSPLPQKYANFAPVRNAMGSAKYQSRQDSGKVTISMKGSLFVPGKTTGRAEVEVVSTAPDAFYGKNKAANVIDEKTERMAKFAEMFIEANKDVPYFTREMQASQEEIFVCGEVVRETNDVMQDGFAHLLLDDENGSILRVNICELPSVNLYPGQIVAFRGVNETGDYLNAKEQLSLPPLPQTPLKKTSLDQLRIWAAAGPFTSLDSLSFEPLCDLLELVKKEEPHVLILMGPFVDRKHRTFMEPTFDAGMREVMDSLMNKVAMALEGCRTELILQASSFRDASSYGYFPSPAFHLPNEAKKVLGKRVHVVADPAIVRTAGVTVALSSSEIVAHLSRAEWHKAGEKENADRIARLAGHLLDQRSMYPLSPAGIPSSITDSLKICELSSAPHLVFHPSMLPASIKVSSGTVLCNPGALLRGVSRFLLLEVNTPLTLLNVRGIGILKWLMKEVFAPAVLDILSVLGGGPGYEPPENAPYRKIKAAVKALLADKLAKSDFVLETVRVRIDANLLDVCLLCLQEDGVVFESSTSVLFSVKGKQYRLVYDADFSVNKGATFSSEELGSVQLKFPSAFNLPI